MNPPVLVGPPPLPHVRSGMKSQDPFRGHVFRLPPLAPNHLSNDFESNCPTSPWHRWRGYLLNVSPLLWL